MIHESDNQDKPSTIPAVVIISPASEITARRLHQFLNEALGAGCWRAALDVWVEAVAPKHDHRFVDNLQRAFPGIPLRTSDSVRASCSRVEPRLWAVECGQLTLACVFAPLNGAADDCTFLPLWTAADPTTGPPEWLWAFEAGAVVRALEDLLSRHVQFMPRTYSN